MRSVAKFGERTDCQPASKLPKTHPKTWRNNDRVISVALWGSIGDEHDTNDTTVKYIPDKY